VACAARFELHGHVLPFIRETHARPFDHSAPLQRFPLTRKFDIAVRHVGRQKINHHLQSHDELRGIAGAGGRRRGRFPHKIDPATDVKAFFVILESQYFRCAQNAIRINPRNHLTQGRLYSQLNLFRGRLFDPVFPSRKRGALLETQGFKVLVSFPWRKKQEPECVSRPAIVFQPLFEPRFLGECLLVDRGDFGGELGRIL
jgi:hypothetical protein